MNPKKINWDELKSRYTEWRLTLYKTTEGLLKKSNKFELSKRNDDGYFHHVSEQEPFEEMQKFWEKEKRVPQEWITHGIYPGIWTAMFSPHNTFSMTHEQIRILRFYFRDDFFLYDKNNSKHRKLLESWRSQSSNPWEEYKNSRRLSMEERMRLIGYLSHKRFYEENRFGAVIGYSDYISPVIVLEDSIEKVEFSTLD